MLPLRQPFMPMEAKSVDEIPTGGEWQYEPKWDGFRCLVFRDGDKIELQSKSGQPLTIELLYSQREQESFLTIYQDDLRKIGIGLNLRLVTPETRFALVMERKFDLVSLGWTGLVFPNPETSVSSRLADVNNTNNVDGIKSARIDELLPIYDREFDPKKRIELIGEIDGILGGDTLIDGFAINFDRTNKKLVVRQTAAAVSDPLAEITPEPTLMNNKVARLIFIGRGHG